MHMVFSPLCVGDSHNAMTLCTWHMITCSRYSVAVLVFHRSHKPAKGDIQ